MSGSWCSKWKSETKQNIQWWLVSSQKWRKWPDSEAGQACFLLFTSWVYLSSSLWVWSCWFVGVLLFCLRLRKGHSTVLVLSCGTWSPAPFANHCLAFFWNNWTASLIIPRFPRTYLCVNLWAKYVNLFTGKRKFNTCEKQWLCHNLLHS